MVSNFRKKKKHFLAPPWLLGVGLLVILCVCGLLLVANAKLQQKKKSLAYQIESLQHTIEDVKGKNAGLSQKISEADDSAYLAKVAREELDLQQPKEHVVSFITPQEVAVQSVSQKKNIFEIIGDYGRLVGNWFAATF